MSANSSLNVNHMQQLRCIHSAFLVNLNFKYEENNRLNFQDQITYVYVFFHLLSILHVIGMTIYNYIVYYVNISIFSPTFHCNLVGNLWWLVNITLHIHSILTCLTNCISLQKISQTLRCDQITVKATCP